MFTYQLSLLGCSKFWARSSGLCLLVVVGIASRALIQSSPGQYHLPRRPLGRKLRLVFVWMNGGLADDNFILVNFWAVRLPEACRCRRERRDSCFSDFSRLYKKGSRQSQWAQLWQFPETRSCLNSIHRKKAPDLDLQRKKTKKLLASPKRRRVSPKDDTPVQTYHMQRGEQ